MHIQKPLSGKTILDLSHRLPGPMAGKLLGDLGARVIKVEDKKFKDPFIYGLFAEMDNSFPIWYENINKNKEILRIDFNDPQEVKEVTTLLDNVDGIIMGIPEKLQKKLGVDLENLKNLNKPLCVVYPKASKEGLSHMHDLNAMAISGILTLHAKGLSEEDMAPPFLPIAGINFGQKMAFDLLGAMINARDTNQMTTIESYLFESTMDVYAPFYSGELTKHDKFLHNGLYPCYNLYQTLDGDYIAMACVEEKFWQSFVELFSQPFSMDERFDTSGKIHESLKSYFKSLKTETVSKLLGDADICINILKNN